MDKLSLILCLGSMSSASGFFYLWGNWAVLNNGMEITKKGTDDFMRHISSIKQATTYCVHPNSHAATVSLKPKRSVCLAILVSCKKSNAVLIINVLYLIKRILAIECAILLIRNLEIPGSKLGPGIRNAEWRFSWFLCFSRHMLGQCLTLGHYHYLPHPFQSTTGPVT
jgi:hypothetical protein